MYLFKLGKPFVKQCDKYLCPWGKSALFKRPVHGYNFEGLRYAKKLTDDVAQLPHPASINPVPPNVTHLPESTTNISDFVTNTQSTTKASTLPLTERPRFNPNTEASIFFGLRSYDDMVLSNAEEIFTNYKMKDLCCKYMGTECARDSYLRNNSRLHHMFDELSPNLGCARMTFYDNCFDGKLHTLGFVRKDDTLYVLDSLGHEDSSIIGFHLQIEMLLRRNAQQQGLNNIIFNNVYQQTMDEITCNHWTFANIESLTRALKSGKVIEDSKVLDSILSTDINKVLEEQYNYVLHKKLSAFNSLCHAF